MIQLELYVSDIEEAEKLFGLFDFKVIQNDKPGFRMLRDVSGFELMLFNPDLSRDGISHWNNLKTSEHGVGVEIVMVVADVEAKHIMVQNLGYKCSELQIMPWGSKEFTFKMKDGYLLRVKQYSS